MSSTWIFDLRYGYYEVRFGGTAKVLQSYFAVAKILILLCTHTIGLQCYLKLSSFHIMLKPVPLIKRHSRDKTKRLLETSLVAKIDCKGDPFELMTTDLYLSNKG